ncbi:chemotaxis protein CheW [Actomonas aquatica]|uniref:Chemotaxis protein CheW n=1 Tax=Actomonas aquatica TaxID=2866162 RepID=A0ABZ1CCM8_9BACT|nr:chemotaxis protein CheW [Opitutus sp. WL0086]WRQ89427.1 chemotaxis protein CheW [Opitutus sp. WL0086]
MNTPSQLCTFYVGDLFLGLDVLSVQEVIRSPELAQVPLAPPTIQGLLNLRGQILTAIDLRRMLKLREPKEGSDRKASMLMILRTANGQVALVVDSVGDVMELTEDTFEPPPDTVPSAVLHLIQGVHKLDRKLLHVLDAEATGSCQAAIATAA